MRFVLARLRRGQGPVLRSKAKQDGKGEGTRSRFRHLLVAFRIGSLLLPLAGEDKKENSAYFGIGLRVA